MGDTKIEWTDKSWNPVRGCAIVSPGCRNCYAMRQAHRQSGPGGNYEGLTESSRRGPVWTGAVRTVEELLDAPVRWRKPARIFVNSMSDLFHDDVPDHFLDKVFKVMESVACGHHTFQILTKRPARMRDYLQWRWSGKPVPVALRRNIWIGVSVEDQERTDERVPLLLQTPAAVRWISAEPLLGPVDLHLTGNPDDVIWRRTHGGGYERTRINWVVVGGESGYSARPIHPTWVRSLRDQCSSAGVAFFFKQWGSWLPICEEPATATPGKDWHEGKKSVVLQLDGDQRFAFPPGAMTCIAMGKKAAGRKLDGRTYDHYPKAA